MNCREVNIIEYEDSIEDVQYINLLRPLFCILYIKVDNQERNVVDL